MTMLSHAIYWSRFLRSRNPSSSYILFEHPVCCVHGVQQSTHGLFHPMTPVMAVISISWTHNTSQVCELLNAGVAVRPCNSWLTVEWMMHDEKLQESRGMNAHSSLLARWPMNDCETKVEKACQNVMLYQGSGCPLGKLRIYFLINLYNSHCCTESTIIRSWVRIPTKSVIVGALGKSIPLPHHTKK